MYYPESFVGKSGDVISSTCADMIMGWKENPIIDYFTNKGEFIGVDQNVSVPGRTMEQMVDVQEYLSNTGYKKEKKKSSDELSGYKCFYFKIKLNPYLGESLKFPLPDGDVVSREVYCVPVVMDNNNLNVDLSGNFDYMVYSDDVDSGGIGISRDDMLLPRIGFNHGVDGVTFGLAEDIKGNTHFIVTIKNVYPVYDTNKIFSVENNREDVPEMIKSGCPKLIGSDDIYECSLADKGQEITFDEFITKFTGYVERLFIKSTTQDEEITSVVRIINPYEDGIVEVEVLDPESMSATFKKEKSAVSTFVGYFFDINGQAIVDDGYTLSTAERYMFYYDNLLNYFNAKDYLRNDSGDRFKDDQGNYVSTEEVLWLNESTNVFEKRYLPPLDNNDKACVLINDSWPGSECSDSNNERNMKYFVDELAKFNEEEIEKAFNDIDVLDPDYSEDVDRQENEDEGTKECYDNSGPLGWILCPVISGITAIGQHMWTQIEEYHMKIPASEVFRTNGGVEKGWETVQNIANIVFIIVFLFIIFSQLTGYGIDNYGIKKLLPRLIVIAILMNLSYVICKIAVDLSNILGIGLNNMFSGWVPSTGGAAAGIPGVGAASLGIAEVAIASGGLFLFQLLTNGSWPGALVGIGLLVLGVVIIIVAAMLTLYLILVAREAGVVLAIIIAPLAFVCYALPNTDKLGKKWFDLFRALILVYPICGAIIGLGQLAGGILSSIDNAGMKIAAMIVQVLPFFFIPMLLKNSLTIMGNVGAKISSYGRSLGQKASRGAQGMIRNSERFKDWSQYQKTRSDAMRSESLMNRLNRRKRGNGGVLSERDNERLLKATETVNAYRQRRAQGSSGAFELDYGTATRRAEASLNAQEQKAAIDEFNGMDDNHFDAEITMLKNNGTSWYRPGERKSEQRMAAIIRAMESRGKEADVFDVLRNNNVSDSTTVMQALAESRNYLMQAYGKKGKNVSFSDFETGGILQRYIEDNGLGSADKDSLEEINSHAATTTISGATSDTVAADMLMKAANNAQIPKVREQMNGLLDQVITRMGSINDLAQLKLSPEDFALMHDDTAKKIKETVMTRFGLGETYAKSELRRVFGMQIREARSNERITSRVSRGTDSVGEIFGIF